MGTSRGSGPQVHRSSRSCTGTGRACDPVCWSAPRSFGADPQLPWKGGLAATCWCCAGGSPFSCCVCCGCGAAVVKPYWDPGLWAWLLLSILIFLPSLLPQYAGSFVVLWCFLALLVRLVGPLVCLFPLGKERHKNTGFWCAPILAIRCFGIRLCADIAEDLCNISACEASRHKAAAAAQAAVYAVWIGIAKLCHRFIQVCVDVCWFCIYIYIYT